MTPFYNYEQGLPYPVSREEWQKLEPEVQDALIESGWHPGGGNLKGFPLPLHPAPVLHEISVLDHGFVRLDDWIGDDLGVVNSARVSLGIKKEILDQADKGLIGFLMRERHGTPFEHNAFKWHIGLPIFVAREYMRHRIGSFNELSGRYKKFEDPDFYIPSKENFRTQAGKPGAYSFEQWKGNTRQAQALMERHYHDCYELYDYFITTGMAKEQARIVLPLSLYTEFYWTVNARSLMNFLSLRNAPQALYEIRVYAEAIEKIWSEKMPVTTQAFIDNGRIAP